MLVETEGGHFHKTAGRVKCNHLTALMMHTLQHSCTFSFTVAHLFQINRIVFYNILGLNITFLLGKEWNELPWDNEIKIMTLLFPYLF